MGINVILKEGTIGKIKYVSRGYARYLIARDKAIPATEENEKQLEYIRDDLQQQENQAIQDAKGRADSLQTADIRIQVRAADSNHLYGSLGAKEIASAVTEMGISLKKEEVKLLSGPIRTLGAHQIKAVLHAQVSVMLTVTVEPLAA